MAAEREPAHGPVADRARRPGSADGARGAAAQGPATSTHVSRVKRRTARTRTCNAGRHELRIRLSGRCAGPVCHVRGGVDVHPRLQGAAHHARSERAFLAALLLAYSAAHRPRHVGAAGTHDGHRWRGGSFYGRERLRRYGGGAAHHSTVSLHTWARRAFHRHDLRDGWRRGNRDGVVRDDPWGPSFRRPWGTSSRHRSSARLQRS